LQDLVKEISPILNFSSFTLLKLSELHFSNQQSEEIILSSQRKLLLQFLGFEGHQARLLIKILKNNKETFKTVVTDRRVMS